MGERAGAITFLGAPLTLVGDEVRAGAKAPDFHCVIFDEGLQDVTLASSEGKVRIFSVTPSLDTPVCDVMAKRFNDEASSLPGDVVVYNVSVDLPFAVNRWCADSGAQNITAISDYQDRSFGEAWGVLIKELKLLARAVFVVDANDVIVYAEIVTEVTEEPDYVAALAAVKAAADG